MDFQFDAEQEELRETARAFLAEHSASAAVRRAMETELGYEPDLWKRIGGELGWTSVHIPECCGGLGLGQVELVALLEIMGESLLCSPFFSTIALGANAILCAGNEAQKAEWLPPIAAGERTATLAFAEPGGGWDSSAVGTSARETGGEWVLRGEKRYVVDGHSAELLVVAAREERGGDDGGIALFTVPGDAPGVDRRALPTMDQTRRLASVKLDDVRIPLSARLGEGDATGAVEHTLQLAAVALAAEQVGGAQRCLDLAVDYARERVQFGRPIGSFQAIKHKLADVMVQVESARSAAYYAGCAAAERSDELPVVASLAKATCSDAYFRSAADCIQVHGGVGFTWEYDVHLHFKRARAGAALLGSAAWHRELVARQIGLSNP